MFVGEVDGLWPGGGFGTIVLLPAVLGCQEQ